MQSYGAEPAGRQMSETIHFGPYRHTINPDVSDNPKFVELKAYWDAKRGSRRMPTRSQIDPLELRGHLGSLFLAEVQPDGSDVRYRLVGTNIVDAYGRDSTGKLMSEIGDGFDPEYRRAAREVYRTIIERCVIARASGPLTVVDRKWRHFTVLLLPLDAGDDTVGMILGEQLFSPQTGGHLIATS